MVKEGGTSTVAAGFMPLTLLVLSGQGHALSSRLRVRALLGTKLITRVCECFRWYFCLVLGVFFVVKPQRYKHQSDMIRNSFPYH